MCLSVASKIYWNVEVIVTAEAKGCTSIYELMEDDGTGIFKHQILLILLCMILVV
jgi:hypothetical protein